jgi:signal transduction histidine kinase
MASISKDRPVQTSAAACREQVVALNQQAWDLRATETQQAIALAEQARAAAERCDYQAGLAHSLFILGHCHYRIADYELARTRSLAALALYESLGDHEGRADALNTIGNVYSGLGDHHSALDFYLQSLEIRQAIGNTQAEAASLNNIANVYFHLTDYPNALEAHLRSLAIKEAIGDQQGVGTSLHNIANVYKETGDYQSALRRYVESLAIFQSIGHKYGEAGALSNMGSIYAALGDLRSALDYHEQSLAIERAIGNKHGEAESLLLLGELYLPSSESLLAPDSWEMLPHQALSYLDQALALAQELDAKELIYKVHLALSQAHQQQGDFALALGHHQAFYAAQRAIFDEELIEKTKRLQIIHQVETSKREAALQRAEAEVFRLKTVELARALADADYHRQIAEQASLLKSELLSIAAHDLKNPLSAIVGYAEMIMLEVPADSPAGDYAQKIHRTSDQMLQIITDLLESTTLDSGNLTLNLRRADLAALAALVIERNRPQAERKRQTLHFSADPDCVCNIDESRIQEIVDNLINNAIKYSPYAQPIWVSVTRTGAMVRLAIRDQGQGLTPEDQQMLFSKFARLSAKPTGGEGATGLGLAIVKLLVDLHGGSVWAESAGSHMGSTFIVELPAADG